MMCGGFFAGPSLCDGVAEIGGFIYKEMRRLFVETMKQEGDIAAPSLQRVADGEITMSVTTGDIASCEGQKTDALEFASSTYISQNEQTISYEMSFCRGSSLYRLRSLSNGEAKLFAADGKTALAAITPGGYVYKGVYNDKKPVPKEDLDAVSYAVHTLLGVENEGDCTSLTAEVNKPILWGLLTRKHDKI